MFVVYLVNNNLVGHCVSLSGCRRCLLCVVYWAVAPFLTSLGLGPWWQVNHQPVFLAVYIPDTLSNSGGLSHLDLNQMHFPTDFLWTSFILTSLVTEWLNAELGGRRWVNGRARQQLLFSTPGYFRVHSLILKRYPPTGQSLSTYLALKKVFFPKWHGDTLCWCLRSLVGYPLNER